MNAYIEKLFGDRNKRLVKALQKDVDQINALEPEIQKLTDEQLRAKTSEFKAKLAEGKTLEDIKYEAFAVVREAARRTLGQRHYDVQLMGGLVLHQGNIAEMKTGEGKTLSATTATYLNALEGKGVHLVTVNDYLARRDADWMGQVYHFLGLTVGCIQHDGAFLYETEIEKVRRHDDELKKEGEAEEGYEALITADMNHLREVTRREAYQADITFGTNNEFGFDYLRDNMVTRSEDRVQRGVHYAIIDEVDSILIDEARTPLIISAPAEDATEDYHRFAQLVTQLQPETDYTIDEKMRSTAMTDAGIAKIEKALGVENLYVDSGIRTVHHIEQALKARALFSKDKDYVVADDEVVIIDEFTGRMLKGRRYSEGLHQAIEAKEGLPIKAESKTLATITLQNLFRLYKKRAGMTGTAMTESEEFYKIYGLDVVSIPSHRELVRHDVSDRVYKNATGKYRAVAERVKELHEKGQPVLLGTISIEHNELLSQLLTANGIPHNVLNAKHHEREAEIIAQAGKLGAVTVATNMAGRGVDILLGGNPVNIEEARKVRELGGLAVIGTERHESRRIDNQLRGRSGRQGDPGVSQFFVSMDDDLMRIFGSDRMKNLMTRLGVPDDMPIENKIVSRSIETAQSRVESHNFDIRKHLVEYDDVMNKHRDVIYKKRNEILEMKPEALREHIHGLVTAEIEHLVSFHTNKEDGDWDVKEICDALKGMFGLSAEESIEAIEKFKHQENTDGEEMISDAQQRTDLIEHFTAKAKAAYAAMIEKVPDADAAYQAEKAFALRAIDVLWVDHLSQMSFLRDSIGLRGYGQRDPLVEYKRESYQLFQALLSNIQREIVYNIYKIGQLKQFAQVQHQHEHKHVEHKYSAPAKEMEAPENEDTYHSTKKDATGEKIGRNDPCPCGSGKKYKKCHGK